MNLLIFFIIILTIVLIVYYYNCDDANSASLIVAIPLLGVIQYMNLREENYNTKEYKILQKEGIIGSNEDNEIKAIEEENDNILNFIIENDSMGFIDENKQDRLTFIKNEFQKMDKDERIFNKFNKYFMFKENIEDPKLLLKESESYKKSSIDKIKNDIINNIQFNDIKKKLKDVNITNFESKLNKNEQAKVSMQNIRKGVDITNKINTYDLSNKNNIKSIIIYMNTMQSINKSNNILSEYLDKYNNYDNYIKEHGDILYDINNIQLFNSLVEEGSKIPVATKFKQLGCLIKMRKIIRENKIKSIDYNKLIKDYDNEKDIKNKNRIIYSLFILYSLNINKINNVKYKNINKESFDNVLQNLKMALNQKLNKEQFNKVLIELSNKKKNDTIEISPLPSALLSSIVNFDKVKLNKKLELAINEYENKNLDSNILDEISIIKLLIKKYNSIIPTYKCIAQYIYTTYMDLEVNKDECKAKISVPNFLTFDNIIKNINSDSINTFISDIQIDTIKDSTSLYIDWYLTHLHAQNETIISTSNKRKTNEILDENNKRDIELEYNILKNLIPMYAKLKIKEYNEQNENITFEIKKYINEIVILKKLTIINNNKFPLYNTNNIIAPKAKASFLEDKRSIKEETRLELACNKEKGEIPILDAIMNNLRILSSELNKQELKYNTDKENVENIQKEMEGVNNNNTEALVDACLEEATLEVSSETLNSMFNDLNKTKSNLITSINDISQKLLDENLTEEEKKKYGLILNENIMQLINVSKKSDDMYFNIVKLSLKDLKCHEHADNKIKEINNLIGKLDTVNRGVVDGYKYTVYNNTYNSLINIIDMIETYKLSIDKDCTSKKQDENLVNINIEKAATSANTANKAQPKQNTKEDAAKQEAAKEEAAKEEAARQEAIRKAQENTTRLMEAMSKTKEDTAKQEAAAKQAKEDAVRLAEAEKQAVKQAKEQEEATRRAQNEIEAKRAEAERQEREVKQKEIDRLEAERALRLVNEANARAKAAEIITATDNAKLMEAEDNAEKARQAEVKATEANTRAKAAEQTAIEEAKAAKREEEEANRKVIDLEDKSKKYAGLDAMAVKAEEVLAKAIQAEKIKKDILDKAEKAVANAKIPAKKKQLQIALDKADEEYKAIMAITEKTAKQAKEARAQADLAKEQLESLIKNLIGKNSNLNNGTTINYSNEERKKIIDYKNKTAQINDDLIKMIISTDPEFETYQDDAIRYNYLNLLQNKESIILKNILTTIKVYENEILNEFVKKTRQYITNKKSNNGIYDFVLDNNIYDITVNEYKTKSVHDNSRGMHKTLLFLFGKMIYFILERFTTDGDKNNYKETGINKIINICQVNKEIIQELDKNLKLENKTNINNNLDNFYKSLEIKDFNNLNLIQSNFNELEKKYKNVNFNDCDEFIDIFQYINKGNDLEELIKAIKIEYTKKNKQLDIIKTNKSEKDYGLGIPEDLTIYAENFGKIDYINLFICISKYVNKFNLELFKEYLSNKKRIELYEQLLPFEKYINLQIKDLKDKIEKLEKDNKLNADEIISLQEKLAAAELAKQECDSSLQSKIAELENIKNILNGRLATIETSLQITNNKKKESLSQKDEIEIRLDVIKALIDKENSNNDILKERNRSLTSEIDTLNQTLEANKAANAELDATKKRIDNELFDIQKQINFIQEQIDLATSSNNDLIAKKEKLQIELTAKTSAKSTLENESSDIISQIQTIQRQIDSVDTINKDLIAKKEELQIELAAKTSANSTIGVESSTIQEQIQTINEQISIANATNVNLISQQQTLQAELLKTNEKLNKELDLNKDLIAENQNTSDRLTSIEQKISEDIKSAIEAKKVAEGEVARIKSELESKEVQYLKTIEELQKSTAAMRLQIIFYKNKYNSLGKTHEQYVTNTEDLINNIYLLLNKINNKQYNKSINFEEIKKDLNDHVKTLEDNKTFLNSLVIKMKNIIEKYPNDDSEGLIKKFIEKNKKIILVSNEVIIRILFTLIKEVKDKDNIISELKTTSESALIAKEQDMATLKTVNDNNIAAKEAELTVKYEKDISDLRASQAEATTQQTIIYNNEKEKLEAEIQRLTSARDEATLEGIIKAKETEINALNQRILTLENEHSTSLSGQDSSFKDQLASLTAKHQTEIKELKQAYQMELEDKDSQIININLLNNENIADLKQLHSDAIQTLNSEFIAKSESQTTTAVNQANIQYQLELRKKEAECEKKILQINTDTAGMHAAEIEAINLKYTEIINDLNRKKDAAVTTAEEKDKEKTAEKVKFDDNLSSLTRTNKEQETKILSLQTKIKNLESGYKIDTQKLANDILSLTLATEGQHKTILSLQNKISNDSSDYKLDMNRLANDIKSLTLANETYKQTIERLEAEIANSKSGHETSTQSLENEISSLKRINKTQEDTIIQLNNNIRILTSTNEEQGRSIYRLKQQIDILNERQSDDIKLLGERYASELKQKIDALKLDHKRETEQLIAEHGFEIERINRKHLEQISTLNSSNEISKLEAIKNNAQNLKESLDRQKDELQKIHESELKNKIDASNLTNGTAIEELNKKHAFEIDELNKKYEIDINKARNNVKASANFASSSILQALKKTQVDEISKLKEKHQDAIIKAKEETLKEAKLNHSLEIDELNKKYEIDLIKASEAAKIAANVGNDSVLQGLKNAHAKEIDELNKKYEIDLKNKIETAKLAASLTNDYLKQGSTNISLEKLKEAHSKEIEDLKNYNKSNIINLKRDIDELEGHIISLQKTNNQIRDEIFKCKQNLNSETKSKNALLEMLSSYLNKYENSEMGLKDAILDEYKKLKPSATNSLENVLNTKLYIILNKHKEIINELNGSKELGKLRIQEISKLIKKVKDNLIEKIVDEVDDNEIDLNNIKVEETQAKYLNKLDELLNKLIQEKYSIYKQHEDSIELVNDILDDYDHYKKNKENEIQKINDEILQYTKEIEEINNNINNITEEFISSNNNNKLSKEFNQQIKKLKEEIYKKNSIINVKNDALSNTDKKYKIQIKLLQEENVKLKNTCREDKQKLEKSITNLHSYYSKEILNLKSTIAEYKSKYTLTEADKEKIELKKLSIDAKYKNEFDLQNSMKSKIETLESKLLFTERELADCLSTKQILTSEIAEIRAENETIKTNLEQNIRDAELLRIENARLKETIQEMEKKCSKISYTESNDVDSEDIYIYVDKKLLESKKEQDKNKYRESGKIFTLDDIKQTKNKKINTLFKKPNDKYL